MSENEDHWFDEIIDTMTMVRSNNREVAFKGMEILCQNLESDQYDVWSQMIDVSAIKHMATFFPSIEFDPKNYSVECIHIIAMNYHPQIEKIDFSTELIRLFSSPVFTYQKAALDMILVFFTNSYRTLRHMYSDQLFQELIDFTIFNNNATSDMPYIFIQIASVIITDYEIYKLTQIEKLFDVLLTLYKTHNILFYTIYEILQYMPINHDVGNIFYDKKIDTIILELLESNKTWKDWVPGMCNMLMCSTKRDLEHIDIYKIATMLKAYMTENRMLSSKVLEILDCLYWILIQDGFDYNTFLYTLFKHELLTLFDYSHVFYKSILKFIGVLVESRDPTIIFDMIELKFIKHIINRHLSFESVSKFLNVLSIILEHGEMAAEIHKLSTNPCLHDLTNDHISMLLDLLDPKHGNIVTNKDKLDIICILSHHCKVDFTKNYHLLNSVKLDEILPGGKR